MSSSSKLPALKSKSILPSIVCFQSVYNDKFLIYQTGKYFRIHGYLSPSGDKVTDAAAHFDVIPSVVEDGLVHLKSRYAHKFLVRLSPVIDHITALADKPNEDQANWACTLFKPSFVDDDSTKIRLFHVQSGHSAHTCFDSYFIVGSTVIDPDSCDIFIVVDWTSLLKLPKNIAFKGDNDKYLGPFIYNGIPYLQFSYENSSDPKVAHEVTSSAGGTITIKSKYYDRFWRIDSDDYIVADIDEPVINDVSSMFRVNVMGVNDVALTNMKTVDSCKRCTKSPGLENLLKGVMEPLDACVLEVTDLIP